MVGTVYPLDIYMQMSKIRGMGGVALGERKSLEQFRGKRGRIKCPRAGTGLSWQRGCSCSRGEGGGV